MEITDPRMEQIEKIYHLYERELRVSIQDVFLSEHIDENGKRIIESLWLFSRVGGMEIREFNSEIHDFDYMKLSGRIRYWRIKNKNFDFINANEDSRMYLKIGIDNFGGGDMKASKNNCLQLKKIFIKYVMRNLEL
jgi:hypothetical protein